MSTHSLLSLRQAVEGGGAPAGRPLLSVAVDLDYPGKPNALADVRFDIWPGEILGLIGESGSGKSSVAMSILRLMRHKGAELRGSIRLNGRELLGLRERELRAIRGREIGLVLQSPLAALNPALSIGTQLKEAWRAHRRCAGLETEEHIGRTLEMVSLPRDKAFLSKRPAALSVGLAQRVLIAIAILHRPQLLIADEPTSALDMITQSEILRLFTELNRELGMAILYISHDLLSVAALCHRVAIMKNGRIVECAPMSRIFETPADQYTRSLVAALPRNPLPEARDSHDTFRYAGESHRGK
jgi:ABC-type dipeptide/oligopeptide/nickel transport system ATPase component